MTLCEGGVMAAFVSRQDSPLSPSQAWERLTAWPNHAKYVPFTSIAVTPAGPTEVGTVFVARTHLGPLSFDDPMEIVEWSPPADRRPGHCRLLKHGTVMLGWAELSVEPLGTGSRATWTEEITVARMPKWMDPASRLTSRLLFTRVLRRLLLDDPEVPTKH